MGTFIKQEAFAVARIDQFRFFLGYRFFMTAATLMQSVIVGWHLYTLTNDVLLLGLIGLTEVVPQISISLFAGHFVDKWNRKKIILYTTTLLLLGSAILVTYSVPALDAYQRFGTFPVFITIFITGLVRGILMPAHTAFMAQLVPRELLTNAATLSSANWQVAAVAGPAIGGLVYAFSGPVLSYLGVFIFYLVAIVLMMSITKIRPVQVTADREGILSSIGTGIRYVFRNKVLLGAFTLDMFAVFFGGAVAVLPVFASDILKIGPQGLGMLRACPAIGALFMSTFLMLRPPLNHSGRYLFACVAGFGMCMIVFALSRNFYLSAIALLLSGSFDNVSVVIRQSILQLFTPDEMKGRVAAVNSIFVGSSNELGAFESGVAAKLMGLVPSVVFGGIMTLIVVAAVASSTPLLRKLSLKDI